MSSPKALLGIHAPALPPGIFILCLNTPDRPADFNLFLNTSSTVVDFKKTPITFLALALLFAACDRSDQQIKVYRVAKAPLEDATSADAAMPTNASSPSSLSTATPGTTITGIVPPNWEPQSLSQMRQASFLVRGDNGAVADISFVTLGPSAGNILDNINRWLGQLAQPPLTQEKLAGAIERLLPTAGGDVAIVDLSGQPENGDASKDGRIIGAIAPEEGRTVFYKMRGNPALVGAQKDNFLKWVSSSRGGDSTANLTAPTAPPSSDKPEIKWEVPPGWSPAPPAPMRYASFTAEKNGEKADISIVTFPGDGGTDADNINRWRQQVGLPAAEASALNAAIVPVQAGEIRFSTVDLSGATARMLAGWTRRDGRAWFFKMTGPKTVVEQEKAKFMTFLQSVRF